LADAREVRRKERDRIRGGTHASDNFCDLFVLWLLGLITSYTLGGFIHILLVLAMVVLVIRLMQDEESDDSKHWTR
jgi:hypothetical protein